MFDLSFGSVGYAVTSVLYLAMSIFIAIKIGVYKQMKTPSIVVSIITAVILSFIPYFSPAMFILTAVFSVFSFFVGMLSRYAKEHDEVY